MRLQPRILGTVAVLFLCKRGDKKTSLCGGHGGESEPISDISPVDVGYFASSIFSLNLKWSAFFWSDNVFGI